jgi:hypothetical protein
MGFILIWILSIVSQVQAASVSKKCLDFFEAVLSDQTNKSAIPVECQYYRVQDLESGVQGRVRKVFSDNQRPFDLDRKLSVVAGEIIQGNLVSRANIFGKKSWGESKPGPGALLDASQRGDLAAVEYILQNHLSRLSPWDLAVSLKWAAYYGQEGVLKKLLSAGANPRFVFKDPGRGSDRGEDMDVIQWLEFNLERCPRIQCVGWGQDSAANVDRALELLRRVGHSDEGVKSGRVY